MMRPVINLGLNMIEMIGTFEQVYMDICIRPEESHEGVTTHQEVNEVSILSFVANFTPFSDFNQSPRNMYQCQMGKQTMGVPCHALQHRSDNKLYKIQTPHTPIVRPVKYDEYDVDLYPSGTNAIVAVISYTVSQTIGTSLCKFFQHEYVIIFLPIGFNICFGCLKESSHLEGSFEYQ